ncbi:MAG: APC family permease [Thermoproteus sp. AZ2]|uniref:APC family permease n=1 Tax=Thermoproteus sp. AZ2 TaxID=1609232 RepID=A0ACC6UZH4_9CREN
MSRKEAPRRIGFWDLLFLTVGGQSPFLSILIYGTATIMLVGAYGFVAVLLGTLLALVNGLVVYYLSGKFTKSGGYYTYAFYSLSKRFGFETGWAYLLYSSFYGAAYVLGAAWALSRVLPIGYWALSALIFAAMALVLLLGIKPTFSYALFASVLEIATMAYIAVYLWWRSGFILFSPFTAKVSPSQLMLAALLGSAIPTGYGSAVPLAGEVKDPKRTVKRVVMSVILLGGLLAAFDVYAITAYLTSAGLSATAGTVVDVIKGIGDVALIAIVIFASLNDGVVSSMAYATAFSRTLFAMAQHGYMPELLSRYEARRGPVFSILLSIGVMAAVVFGSLYSLHSAYLAFEVAGVLSMLGNVFVHIVANASLLRISLKRAWRRVGQIALSGAALAFSFYVFASSLASTQPLIVYAFLAWLLLGFILIEFITIAREEEEE